MLHLLSLIYVLKPLCLDMSYVTSSHVVRAMLVFFDCAHIESRPRERTVVKTASQKLLGRCSHWLAWNVMSTEPHLTLNAVDAKAQECRTLHIENVASLAWFQQHLGRCSAASNRA
jgi:hypothetical protein